MSYVSLDKTTNVCIYVCIYIFTYWFIIVTGRDSLDYGVGVLVFSNFSFKPTVLHNLCATRFKQKHRTEKLHTQSLFTELTQIQVAKPLAPP